MAGLETYRAKRNFGVTAEPRGRVARAKAKSLTFVIQRHAATRLHYDFRLELDGVLKSWAVTKVPSLDPATKRLAVEVEDHPLEYGGFEGTIPQGEYGGGTVQLWDNGTWTPQGDDPHRDLAKGHLKFVLDGKRLHGGWALIRLRDEPGKLGKKPRHNWLLIKEKDDAALPGEPDALLATDTSVTTGRTLDEIASSKKPRVWQSNRNTSAAAGDNGGDEPAARSRVKKKNPSAARVKTAKTRKPH